MKQRILAALVALPLVLIPIWLGGLWWVGLVTVIAILAGFEYYSLLAQGGYRTARWLGLVWLLSLVYSSWLPQQFPLPLTMAFGLVITLIYALYQVDQPLINWTATVAGAAYLGILIGQILALRLAQEGLWWLMLGLLITWGNDTLAYLTGITLGRHKLWPRLSPKKSWEGTVGGWITAALIGGFMMAYTPLSGGFGLGLLIGLGGGVLALFGDLSVSMIKRQVGAKDSGRLFPGHGGMLDRLDSILFVVPYIFQVMLLLTQPG